MQGGVALVWAQARAARPAPPLRYRRLQPIPRQQSRHPARGPPVERESPSGRTATVAAATPQWTPDRGRMGRPDRRVAHLRGARALRRWSRRGASVVLQQELGLGGVRLRHALALLFRAYLTGHR